MRVSELAPPPAPTRRRPLLTVRAGEWLRGSRSTAGRWVPSGLSAAGPGRASSSGGHGVGVITARPRDGVRWRGRRTGSVAGGGGGH